MKPRTQAPTCLPVHRQAVAVTEWCGMAQGKKPDGTPYDYGKDYGNMCEAHDDTDTSAKAPPADAWEDEEWCYIDCSCKTFPAHQTSFLTEVRMQGSLQAN